MAIDGESTVTTPTPVSAALRAAADEMLGEAAAGDTKQAAEQVAAAKPKETEQAAGAAKTQEEPQDNGAALRELQAFAQSQERWGREREQLRTAAKAAKDEAKRDILAALDSDDPDGALEELGLSVDQRRAIVKRMVLRHVPADKADPAMRSQIEMDQLRAETRATRKAFDEYVKQQTEEREQERQKATAQKAVDEALETLHGAFRSAGDDLGLVRTRYGKRRDATVRDALEVGKELAAQGVFTSRMAAAEIAQRIVKELNKRYREDFGLADGAGSQAEGTPLAATPQKKPPPNAAEANAARTISRGATEVTRPPPSQEEPLDEEAWLEEEGRKLAKLRRDGAFSPTA
jgi:hypothetical protein